MTNNQVETPLLTASVPLLSIDRGGINEVVVGGMIAVVEGASNRALLSHGDVNYRLWSRSLLKPWQLLSHYDELKANYSWLRDEHFALMMSSHSCEAPHLKLLEEIERVGGISRDFLGCPATYPISHEMKAKLKSQGAEPQSIYHNCSGKHFGYLLALKAEGKELESYLNREKDHHKPLVAILASLTDRSESTFNDTTDGCQLPNFALSPQEMAAMYRGLVCGKEYSDKRTAQHGQLALLMRKYARMIGGSERLDTRLMEGSMTSEEVPVLAKEGADGLLGIGIGPSPHYNEGLGILIKLASGTDSRVTELVARELLRQLGLLQEKTAAKMPGPPVKSDHIKNQFHFQLAVAKVR